MTTGTNGRNLPLWKKALFAALMLLLVLVVIEAAAYVAGSVTTQGHFSHRRLQARRHALVASDGRATVQPRWIQDEVVHPYVGYVPLSRAADGGLGVTRATRGSTPTGTADRVVIAVVGGSFAEQFADEGLPHLITRLGELPAFRGKTLVRLNAAVSGYKQPQQLMTVVYLLSLGERFDILINLDGLNDVVLHPTENAPAGVSPAYPRRWHQRVEGMLPGGALRLMLQRVLLEQRRAGLARTFSRFPWRDLNTANVVYVALDRDVERQLAETDRKLLNEEQRTAAPAVATGPRIEFKDDGEMFAYLAGLWRRSSRVLHDVAAGQGIRYYHFLQPNQYVPGSKPMGPREKADALRSKIYSRVIATAYPMLSDSGRALAAEGVRFTDLTGAFATHPEPLYVDACCHVNRQANVIVADLIFDAIRRDVQGDADRRARDARPGAR
jgi:hypothetical protein